MNTRTIMRGRSDYIYRSVLLGLTAILAFSVLYLMYLSSDGSLFNEPITFNSTLLQTTKQTYKPGETVFAIVDFCKHRDIAANVQWEIVDTVIRFYPEETRSSPIGCFRKEMEVAKIPPDLSPAQYYFVGLIRYRINPLSEVQYRLNTNTFTVVK